MVFPLFFCFQAMVGGDFMTAEKLFDKKEKSGMIVKKKKQLLKSENKVEN